MVKYDNLKGLLDHKHYGSDIIDITSYIGQPLGVFTTAYPITPSVGRYDFAGTDGTTISGTVYNNGDSAFWDGSVWTRIPKQVINIEQVRSQSTNLAPSSKLMDDELSKLVAKSAVKQTTGISETDVISQKVFSQLENDIYYRDIDWTVGYYYDINGDVIANENNSICKFKIPVVAGKKITVNNFCLPIVYSHFVDRNGAIVNSFNNTGTAKDIIVPTNAVYLLLTNRHVAKSNSTVALSGVFGFFDILNSIESDYLKIADVQDNITSNDAAKPFSAKQGTILARKIDFKLNWITGSYYTSTGAIANHGDFSILPEINVVNHGVVELNPYMFTGALAYCLFVNDLGNVISSFQNLGTKKRLVVPSGATKLLVSNRTTSKDNSSVYVRGYGLDYESARQRYAETNKLSTSPRFMHFSFDDVNLVLQDLTNNSVTYSSIFENSFLSKLKEWHDLYGAVFSLFVYDSYSGWQLSSTTTKFASEFYDNSDWLKFGLHGQYTLSTTYANALSNYNSFAANIVAIAGTTNAIDRMPRFHGFSGGLECCKGVRDANAGVVGLLTADDSRPEVYYLSTDQVNYIGTHDRFYDATNFLYFMKTETRLESVSNIATFLDEYLTQIKINQANDMVIFTHEQQIYPTVGGGVTQSMIDKIVACCEWAISNNYRFDFPMNVVLR